MKTYMMEIKELKFSYGFKKPDIFSDFSLTLQPGAVYGRSARTERASPHCSI